MPAVSALKDDIVENIQKQILAEQALAAADHCLAVRYPGAAFAYAAGSIMRGEGTDFSDIDMVVVFASLENAWRESFQLEGFPIEAFVHDPQTLAHFFHSDVESGCPVIVNMVATGRILGPDITGGRGLQAEAARLLAEGPHFRAGEGYETLRYVVSDLADDLRGERPSEETAAIAAQLYQKLGDLMLLGRGAWSGRGKWVPRLLRSLDARLADEFETAFRLAAQGNGARFLALADRELELLGGRHFEGYRRDAPAHFRR